MIVDRLPSIDARNEGIHEHELLRLRRKERCIRVGHHQSDVMSHNNRRSYIESGHQAMDSSRSARQVEAGRWNIRFPDARQVRSDYRELSFETRNQRPPHQGRLRVSVE